MVAFQFSTIQVLGESLSNKAYPKGYLDDQRRLLVQQVSTDSVTDNEAFVQNTKQTLKASQAVVRAPFGIFLASVLTIYFRMCRNFYKNWSI